MKKLLLILATLLLIPTTTFATQTITDVIIDKTRPLRFTAGWAKYRYKAWHINVIESSWKVLQKNSLFKLGVGGSISKSYDSDVVSGNLDAGFLTELIELELPQSYRLSKHTKKQLWVALIGYEYYYSIWDKKWWKIDFDFYPSIGILGQFEFLLRTSDYAWKITVDDDQWIGDTLGAPTKVTRDLFNFFIPVCTNFDAGILSLRVCGTFPLTQKLKHSGLYGSFSFGL